MAWLLAALVVWTGALAVLLAAAVAVSCAFYRREFEDAPLLPMTLIRPLRGAEDGLYENLAAPVEADREGALQLLLAMETRDDPAHEVAERVAREHPGRDIEIVVTGPSGERMGKMHNMIEALKKAKHPVVVFSDSDVRPDRGVLALTSQAFAQGADAASALPDAAGPASPGDALVGVCFNHYFVFGAAIVHRTGLFTPMAGGWLACRKEFLEELGGLEGLADCAADDAAIAFAAKRLGAKAALVPRLARIRERGGSLPESARHVMKWAKIIRVSAPGSYALLPFFNPVLAALAALGLARASGLPAGAFAPLLGAVALERIFGAWIFDRRAASGFFPAWIYLSLPLLDVACVVVWLLSYFSDAIEWRGKNYRLLPGGRLKVIAP